jgi:hypothetical protein
MWYSVAVLPEQVCSGDVGGSVTSAGPYLVVKEPAGGKAEEIEHPLLWEGVFTRRQ